MRNHTTALLAVTAAALLALTACSSNDDPSSESHSTTAEAPATTAAEQPSTTPTPAAAELERVAGTYTDLYFGGSGKAAYAFLSKRCQAKADPTVYEATVKQAAKDYGPDHPATDVHATVSGDMGRVSYKVKGLPKFDQTGQPWTREGGTWKYDAC